MEMGSAASCHLFSGAEVVTGQAGDGGGQPSTAGPQVPLSAHPRISPTPLLPGSQLSRLHSLEAEEAQQLSSAATQRIRRSRLQLASPQNMKHSVA